MPSSSCAHRDMHRGVCLDCGMYEAGGVTGRGATRDPHRDGCVHDPVWACEPCLTARAAGRGTTFSDLGCDCGQPNNSGKHTADGCTPQEPGRVPTCEMAHPRSGPTHRSTFYGATRRTRRRAPPATRRRDVIERRGALRQHQLQLLASAPCSPMSRLPGSPTRHLSVESWSRLPRGTTEWSPALTSTPWTWARPSA